MNVSLQPPLRHEGRGGQLVEPERPLSPYLDDAVTGLPTATRSQCFATSSADFGWTNTGWQIERCPRRCLRRRCAATNSKNCVACTIEYGIGPFSMSVSWASFARK